MDSVSRENCFGDEIDWRLFSVGSDSTLLDLCCLGPILNLFRV